jgi:hypothetical protein
MLGVTREVYLDWDGRWSSPVGEFFRNLLRSRPLGGFMGRAALQQQFEQRCPPVVHAGIVDVAIPAAADPAEDPPVPSIVPRFTAPS